MQYADFILSCDASVGLFIFLINPRKKSTTNGLFLKHHLQRLKHVLSEARNMEIDIDLMNTISHWLQWSQL